MIAGSSGGHILPALAYINNLSLIKDPNNILFISNKIGTRYLGKIESNKINKIILNSKNKFAAAPVKISKENIKTGSIKYIFVNSGNANACTGIKGYQNTKRILSSLSKKLLCSSDEILIMSTGIIGRQLPINKIIHSISSHDFDNYCSLKSAASAIMTTDKYPKYLTKSYMLGRKKIRFR